MTRDRDPRREVDIDDDLPRIPQRSSLSPGKRTLTSRIPQQRAVQPGPSAFLMRTATGAAPTEEGAALADWADWSAYEKASGGGEPLPAELRGELEASLGAELGSVRIHHDGAAGERADAVKAKAYAQGQDVHFASGAFDPDSEDGQRLIAHEVAHTVQQQGTDTGSDDSDPVQPKLTVTQPGDAFETEADQVADAFIRGGSRPVQLRTFGMLARKERDGEPPEGGANPFQSEHADVAVRFTGQRIARLAASAPIDIPAEDLPDIEQIHAARERFKADQAALGAVALESVRDRPEMRFTRQRSTKSGDEFEFPATYLKAPPTEEVKAFITVTIVVSILDRWFELKSEHMSDEQLRLDQVGGLPIQGKQKDIAQYRQQLIAQKTLGALTGSFGGVIGFAVASALSDDAEFIADAAVLGENITSSMDGVGLRGVTKGKEPRRQAHARKLTLAAIRRRRKIRKGLDEKRPARDRTTARGPSAQEPQPAPHKPLTAKQEKALKAKLADRSITKEEHARLEWHRRFKNRRKRGIDRYWSAEKRRLLAGEPPTRNWTPQQRQDILADRVPKDASGNPIPAHHKKSALEYPQLADEPDNLYPATDSEHLGRWHGGDYRNPTHGQPRDPDFPEEF